MNKKQTLIDHEELDRYEESVQAFINNQLDAERFQSMRLQQGVYGQRQEGVNMIRIKIPGGKFNPDQMDAIADIVENYSQHDTAHVTTRQSIQVHFVPLEKTGTALKSIAKAELTSREACNNTIRNISACPLSGVCPHQHTDVTTHLDGAMRHFLRHPLTQHLPRKFKMSFSACETDCAQGRMHDLAVVAVNNDGQFGFKIMAGGGLGHKPREAIVVEEFIEEKNLLASMEALITLHNRYSDRKKRAKSRIKFLVDRFGAEEFIKKYKEEYERTLTALADIDPPTEKWQAGKPDGSCGLGAPREVLEQKQTGLHIYPIRLLIGNITVSQMRGIASLMREEGLDEIRTTQDQNLSLINVPSASLETVRSKLSDLGLGEPKTGDDVVACPGTSTCRLGITSSTILGPKLSGGDRDLRIRVSGCHNGCAQPETGDIGIYGEGKRKHGKLIPHYQMYFGGDGRSMGSIGFKSLSIPSARIEAAIELVEKTFKNERTDGESFFDWSQKNGKDYFNTLLADLANVDETEVPSILHDHGDESDFKVLQLGGGECAGAAQETVAANFAEAANERNYRNAFKLQRKYTESMECATQVGLRIGQSLLFLAGEPSSDNLNEIGEKISTSLPGQHVLGGTLKEIAVTLDKLKDNFDLNTYDRLSEQMDQWTADAAIVCQNIDQQLDLSASVPKTHTEAKKKLIA